MQTLNMHLKLAFQLTRTLSGSLDYSNGSEEFSAELTLHSEVLSPEAFPCTPANTVEVHDDKQMSKGEFFIILII